MRNVQPEGSHFIGGRLRTAPGEEIVSIYPASAQPVAHVTAADAALVGEAVEVARGAQAEWAARPAAERGRVLRRTADLLRARNQELSEIETIDTGKPISETLVADAASGADCLEYFGGIAATIAG